MYCIDNFCHDLANLLINRKEKSDGFLEGNSGIVLFLLTFSRKKIGNTKNIYEERADSLLENILYSQDDTTSTCFENGLAGIGWLIEYLIQHKYSTGNTDDILEDFDTKIYKKLLSQKEIIIDIRIGLIGYLLYIINRLKTKTNDDSMRTQINRELLIETINKIDAVAPKEFIMITKDIHFNLLWPFPLLLLSLNEAYKLNIYNNKIENILNQWLFYYNTHIPSIHTHRLSLAISLFLTYQKYKIEKIEKHIKTLLYSIDTSIIESEINMFNNNNIQYGWVGIVLILTIAINVFDKSCPNYDNLILLKNFLLHKHKNKTFEEFKKYIYNNDSNFSLGLFNGWTGIGLLYLLYPSIFEEY